MPRSERDVTVRCPGGGPVIGSLVVDARKLRGGLAAGRRFVGTVVSLPDVGLAELTASAAQAARVAERLPYPPRGTRGLAARRASWYGRDAGPAAEPVLMVQIES